MINKDKTDQENLVNSYHEEMPGDEFMKLLVVTLEAECGNVDQTIIVQTFETALGGSVTFANLHTYRSLQGHAVKTWLKDAIRHTSPGLDQFICTSKTDESITWSKMVWITKEMPLATKIYLNEVKRLVASNPEHEYAKNDPRLAAYGIAEHSVLAAWNDSVLPQLLSWYDSGRPGHPFDIGMRGLESDHVSRTSRKFDRHTLGSVSGIRRCRTTMSEKRLLPIWYVSTTLVETSTQPTF